MTSPNKGQNILLHKGIFEAPLEEASYKMLRKTEPLYLQIFRSSLEISDEVLEIVCYLKRDKIYLKVKSNSNAQ